MQSIPTASLQDLPSRVAYLSSFLSLTEADNAALHAAKPLIAPLIPSILDAVYSKLLDYDITAKAFVPKNTDYEGELVKDVQELTLEHPQIALRKDFLKNYLVRLVSAPSLAPSSPFWTYLNNVGIMHTGRPGFKHREKRPDLKVDYIHMGALLGFVVDVVIGAVLEMDLEIGWKGEVLRAFNKVVWIQNDLMARWYIDGGEVEVGETEGGGCPFAK